MMATMWVAVGLIAFAACSTLASEIPAAVAASSCDLPRIVVQIHNDPL